MLRTACEPPTQASPNMLTKVSLRLRLTCYAVCASGHSRCASAVCVCLCRGGMMIKVKTLTGVLTNRF
jgi:hypothetical protein